MPKDVRDLARAQTTDAIDTLAAIMRGELCVRFGRRQEVPPSIRERLDAAEALLDRGWGRPAESVAVTGGEGGPLVVEIRKLGGAE